MRGLCLSRRRNSKAKDDLGGGESNVVEVVARWKDGSMSLEKKGTGMVCQIEVQLPGQAKSQGHRTERDRRSGVGSSVIACWVWLGWRALVGWLASGWLALAQGRAVNVNQSGTQYTTHTLPLSLTDSVSPAHTIPKSYIHNGPLSI